MISICSSSTCTFGEVSSVEVIYRRTRFVIAHWSVDDLRRKLESLARIHVIFDARARLVIAACTTWFSMRRPKPSFLSMASEADGFAKDIVLN